VENTTLSRLPRPKKSDDPERAAINMNFIIKWKLKDHGGIKALKGTHLVSAGKYMAIIEKHTELDPGATKTEHFNRALSTKEQNLTIITRDNLIVQFFRK